MRRRLISITLIIAVVSSGFLFYRLTRPYKIGVIFSIDMMLGYEEFLAVSFYKDRLENIGLHPVKVILKASQNDEESIRKACRELIDDNVSVIIGGSISSASLIVLDELKESGIPFWGVTASTDILSNRKDNFFRIQPSTEVMGAAYAKVFEQKGYRKILIVRASINTNYSERLTDSITKNFHSEYTVTEYYSGFEELLDLNTDAVMCISPSMEMLLIINAVKDRKPDTDVFAADWGVSAFGSLFAIPDIDGFYSVSRSGYLDSKYEDVLSQYFEAFNIIPSYGALTAIIVLEIIHQKMSVVGNSPERLLREFSKPAYFRNGYCDVYLNEFGDGNPEELYLRVLEQSGIRIENHIINDFFLPGDYIDE